MLGIQRYSVAMLVLLATFWTPSPAAADDAIADVRGHLTRLEKLGFAGSVVIARGGVPLLAEGFGLADRERGIPWAPGTVSTVGSITKQFTGAAILTLAEKGLLSVEDPITKYFEGVPEDKRGITLHHLLTHSSGIVDLDGAGDWDPIGREEFVRRALEQELAFPPGERYEYSNAGYSLLGAIVEQLTGKSWEEYVRERLLLPAGMYETGYILAPWGEARLAQGYQGGERWGTVVERPFAPDGPYWVLRANGGIHSTAWDMLRWGQALLAGEPLSAESMAAYWSPHVDEGGGDSFYGYGWVVLDQDGTRVITHNGGNSIHFADMAIVPAAEVVMVILTNVVGDFQVAQLLLERLGGRLLMGRALPKVPDLDPEPRADLGKLAGTYRIPGGGELRVTAADRELAIEASDPRAFAALLSTRPVDTARADRLSARIDSIVASYLKGDFEPLWEAYDRPGSLESFAARAGETVRELMEEHGPLRGHRVLGTAFVEGRDVTLARLLFENGEDDRAYVWNPDEEDDLRGVSRRGLDTVLHVLPEVGGTFASWDPRSGASRAVAFELAESGALRLAIGGDPRVEAVREPAGR